ncbi:hypothetical protein UY3_07985 [Chelonia mydas]|uniref:Uncharacterized protein n=1 Tax=Chelonia mydas TaxID=8469 RepID=M7BRZ1_CHEMY|nr:hypothetical protein UY3_07985 [Chelonia mydas]
MTRRRPAPHQGKKSPTPVSQPTDDTMEGWVLIRGKRGKQKTRVPLLPSEVEDTEAPQKTRKGATNTRPSALPPGESHPLEPAGDDVAAMEGHTATPPESFLKGAFHAPLPPKAPASPEASIASGTSEEVPGVVSGDFPSIFAEMEALGLTPVTQGEDDPLLGGLNLSDLTPAPLSPCSVPLTAASAPTSEEPLDSSTSPATDGPPLMAAEPIEATASATRMGPESPGTSLAAVGQPTSFPGGGPTADSPPKEAVAAPPSFMSS